MLSCVPFSCLIGKTLTAIDGLEKGSEEIVFATSAGERFVMNHRNDCCECVSVEDFEGSVEDLIGTPILLAEESTKDRDEFEYEYGDDSATWTFYRLGTVKGSLVIRWLGQSNGYYSESVDFYESANVAA